MDEFALASRRKAASAIDAGASDAEVIPVKTANGTFPHDEGEHLSVSMEAMAAVKTLTEGAPSLTPLRAK